jgi:uncharacterized protein YndB with AHSA1/START domain
MKAYKIMERHQNGFRTLFHGNWGSRIIPVNQWVEAQIREEAKDGTSKTTYRSGWHSLEDYDDCEEYLSRFKKRLADLVIVEVKLGGEIWTKKHSRSNVLLSSKLYIKKG